MYRDYHGISRLACASRAASIFSSLFKFLFIGYLLLIFGLLPMHVSPSSVSEEIKIVGVGRAMRQRCQMIII